MVILKNDTLCARIQLRGAELKSLTRGDTEYIWPGDEAIWASSAPLVFPICSAMKDDSYYYEGKKYAMQKHGYARFCTFKVETQTESCATFLLCSDEESRKYYPFDYELRITYRLEENTLFIGYNVKNCSKTDMYFSIGAHTGYFCPEGVEQYDLLLPEKESLVNTLLQGDLLGYQTQTITENSDRFALTYDYFEKDPLTFEHLKAREVVLKNRVNGRAVKVCFPGFDTFLIWTKPGAPFVCLEPWCGITDRTDTTQDITVKEKIQTLAPGAVFTREHSMEIVK